MPTIHDLPLEILKMMIEDYDLDWWGQYGPGGYKQFWKLYKGPVIDVVHPVILHLKIVNNTVMLSYKEHALAHEYKFFKRRYKNTKPIITTCLPGKHDMVEFDGYSEDYHIAEVNYRMRYKY